MIHKLIIKVIHLASNLNLESCLLQFPFYFPLTLNNSQGENLHPKRRKSLFFNGNKKEMKTNKY